MSSLLPKYKSSVQNREPAPQFHASALLAGTSLSNAFAQTPLLLWAVQGLPGPRLLISGTAHNMVSANAGNGINIKSWGGCMHRGQERYWGR